MQHVGRSSWRLSLTFGADAHVALWVRDSLRLPVPDDGLVPPPLVPPPPARTDPVSPAGRAQAGAAWAGWWRELLELEAREQLRDSPQDPGPAPGRAAAEDLARDLVGAPPEFDGLSYAPDLQRAAREVDQEAREWVGRVVRDSALTTSRALGTVARREAEAAAVVRGVDVGEVSGAVNVLLVDGVWWRPVLPGAVVCSRACLTDEASAAVVLGAAFAGP